MEVKKMKCIKILNFTFISESLLSFEPWRKPLFVRTYIVRVHFQSHAMTFPHMVTPILSLQQLYRNFPGGFPTT